MKNSKLEKSILKVIVISILVLTFLITPFYVLAASNSDGEYNDDYYDEVYINENNDEVYSDEYSGEEYPREYGEVEYEGPPIDLSIWPGLEYVLEIDSVMMGKGAVHRQYYGKHVIRTETISEAGTYVVIFQFKENGVEQIVLLNDEKQYMKNIISYGEFFETNDSYGNLITRTLPGEEMAMPGYEKLGEVEYLGREVEEWVYIDNSEGESVTIKFLIDRELRQILQMTFNGEVSYKVSRIEIRNISAKKFSPPEDFEAFSY